MGACGAHAPQFKRKVFASGTIGQNVTVVAGTYAIQFDAKV